MHRSLRAALTVAALLALALSSAPTALAKSQEAKDERVVIFLSGEVEFTGSNPGRVVATDRYQPPAGKLLVIDHVGVVNLSFDITTGATAFVSLVIGPPPDAAVQFPAFFDLAPTHTQVTSDPRGVRLFTGGPGLFVAPVLRVTISGRLVDAPAVQWCPQ
jgi:hypothetical protein